MEHVCQLLCSQQALTKPCSDPDETDSLLRLHFINIYFNSILESCFVIKLLIHFLIYLMRAKCTLILCS
jgi:hypothetical protein